VRRRDLLAAAAAPLVRTPETDADLFAAMLQLARRTALAYEWAAGSGRLEPPVARVAARFAAQEAEHAAALRTALEALGGALPPRPGTVPGLDAVRDGRAFAAFAARLERRAIAGYVDAVRGLTDPGLLATVASIVAVDGQQLAVLRGLAGAVAPVTIAFETGSG